MKTSLYLILLTLIPSLTFSQSKSCEITGTVDNRSSDYFILRKVTDKIGRSQGIKIPINADGSFQQSFSYEHNEPYNLAYSKDEERSAWRLIFFFPIEGKVSFNLDEENRYELTVDGGIDNKKYYAFDSKRIAPYLPVQELSSKLSESGNYFTQEFQLLIDSLGIVPTEQRRALQQKISDLQEAKLHLTPEARTISNSFDSLKQEEFNYTLQYANEEISVVSLYLLYHHLRFNKEKIDTQLASQAMEKLAKAFPEHPYVSLCSNMLQSISQIKVGGDFVDFSAPNLEGNMVKASDHLGKRYTLINLWGSWCGPCIRKSREVIPIYEAYKDKGFNVLGVAREFNNTKGFVRAMERDQYPWLNLIDLNGKKQIWNKYGVSTQGGAMFLVDEQGKIVALDPSPEELEGFLKG